MKLRELLTYITYLTKTIVYEMHKDGNITEIYSGLSSSIRGKYLKDREVVALTIIDDFLAIYVE